MKWPQRPVYFFFGSGEARSDSGDGPRVVRVGTHALKAGAATKLWTLLSQHRGEPATGRGNHQGSIFRLIAGAALIRRDWLSFPKWGDGNSASDQVRQGELAMEQRVSAVVGAMSFLWVDIPDDAGPETRRGCIERNAIALLSNQSKPALDQPSRGWLGHHSDRARVRSSGLWN